MARLRELVEEAATERALQGNPPDFAQVQKTRGAWRSALETAAREGRGASLTADDVTEAAFRMRISRWRALERDPARALPFAVLVLGRTDTGKTTLCKVLRGSRSLCLSPGPRHTSSSAGSRMITLLCTTVRG